MLNSDANQVQQALGLKRKQEKHEKKLKCDGCGAICDMGTEGKFTFQAHCAEVEHDDDFMFTCQEVVVCDGEVVQQLVAGQYQ